MKQQKIKKGLGNPFAFWGLMTTKEKVVILIPVVLAVVLLIYIFAVRPGSSNTGNAHSNRELLLETAGVWESFDSYGIDVWLPEELPAETLGGEYDKYMKLHAQRDKGHFPEITVGTIVVPETDGKTFSIEHDVPSVMDTVRPYISEAFALMFNGTQPSLMVDAEVIQLSSGEYAIQAKGEASLTVVYEDPKKPGEPYAEETFTNIFYMIKIFQGWPVVAWGTWDYSTYEGEARTIKAVQDALTSIIRTDGKEVAAPQVDDYDPVEPVYGVPYEGGIEEAPEEKPIVDENGMAYQSMKWNEEDYHWEDTETGEFIINFPHPDDSYWEDKEVILHEDGTFDMWGYWLDNVDDQGLNDRYWVHTSSSGAIYSNSKEWNDG